MVSVDPIRDRNIYNKIKHDLKEWNEKYYIMFLIGSLLALRINEILSLRIGDVAGKREHTFRQSKTGKEITIAFNSELTAALKTYCAGKDPQEALIPSRDNEYKPLSDKRAWVVMSTVGNRYGLHLGTHSLRKTCAYHYYIGGLKWLLQSNLSTLPPPRSGTVRPNTTPAVSRGAPYL